MRPACESRRRKCQGEEDRNIDEVGCPRYDRDDLSEEPDRDQEYDGRQDERPIDRDASPGSQ